MLTRDIQKGLDPLIAAAERLADQFPGVEFGAAPGSPPVDPGGTPPGTDPIRLGSGNIASFSATGTSTSGTIYIRGRHAVQYAVRIFGETGKTRMLKLDSRNGMETVMRTAHQIDGARRLRRSRHHRIGGVNPGHRAPDRRVVTRGAHRDQSPIATRHGRRTRGRERH